MESQELLLSKGETLKDVYMSFFEKNIKHQYSSLIQKTDNIQKFYYNLLRPEIKIEEKVIENIKFYLAKRSELHFI